MLPFSPSSTELAVDPQLGYPAAFAKLCNHLRLFSRGSPLVPRSLSAEQATACEELDALFPVCSNDEDETEAARPSISANIRKHWSFLWSQLDHLGNAGFDPERFRVDHYGNVLQWDAPLSSPLAWDLDHWFPKSRGGRTVPANLRLIQWQVALVKGQKLEFLMPWWDLQLGISVAQFLHVYASSNADFRRRGLTFLFHDGNGDAHRRRHAWPPHFKEQAEQYGLAAAAIVKVRTDDDTASSSGSLPQLLDEEDPLISTEFLGTELASFSPDDISGTTMREASEDPRAEVEQRKEQIHLMKKELSLLRHNNERERMVLQELESSLTKHKKQLEKQWHWSETYRHCFERIIRDVLHQSFMFREQARLNQSACNTLLAKIRSHKMNCEIDEVNSMSFRHHEMNSKRRQQPESLGIDQKNITDDEVLHAGHTRGTEETRSPSQQASRREPREEIVLKPTLQSILEEDAYDTQEEEVLLLQHSDSREVPNGDRYVQKVSDVLKGTVRAPHKVRDELQLSELLQEALTVKENRSSSRDAPGDGELDFEIEKRQQLGKMNVDKWLQKLLQSTVPVEPLRQDAHTVNNGEKHSDKSSKKPVLDGILRMRGFRHSSKKGRTEGSQDDAKSVESSEDPWEARKSTVENEEAHWTAAVGEEEESAACDMEFVMKMREIREEEKRSSRGGENATERAEGGRCLNRSHSMRVGRQRWEDDVGGRRRTDSAPAFSPIQEEDDMMMMMMEQEVGGGGSLQPSWSMREGDHESAAAGRGHHHRSLWRTYTKAWKRAVSKRRSSSGELTR